jgi:hypothetical protein
MQIGVNAWLTRNPSFLWTDCLSVRSVTGDEDSLQRRNRFEYHERPQDLH